jgi:two-component system NarL family response regulator
MNVVAEAPDGRVGAELYRQHLPDVVLMDLRMPVASGVETIQELRHEFPGAKVIVLTTFDGDEDVYRAMQAGARGYLLKGMEAEELIAAIRCVHAGQSSLCAPIAEQLAHRMSTPELTPRELEVLETIVAGKSNREIASSLDVSEATVKTHLNSLFSKLNVVDRTQAAITALQRGLVHLDSMADKLTFSRSTK